MSESYRQTVADIIQGASYTDAKGLVATIKDDPEYTASKQSHNLARRESVAARMSAKRATQTPLTPESSTFFRHKMPEVASEKELSPLVFERMNTLAQKYGLRPLEKDTVIFLEKRKLDAIGAQGNRDRIHPLRLNSMLALGRYLGLSPDLFTFDTSDLGAYVDAVDKTHIYFANVNFQTAQHRDAFFNYRIGAFLLEEMVHRSCQSGVYPVDNDAMRAASAAIIHADAVATFSSIKNPLLPTALRQYEEQLHSYICHPGQESYIVSDGFALYVQTDGKILSETGYNANEIATSHFTQDMVRDYISMIKNDQEYRQFTRLGHIQENKMHSPGSRAHGVTVPFKEVSRRLALYGSQNKSDQLAFYLSGQYFGAHIAQMPDQPFLP